MTTRSLHELFVDRLRQLERFRKSLDGSSGRKVILITAGPGMGKSWLLRRFEQEAREGSVGTSLVDFSDGQAYDVLTLLRRFRDNLGAAHFNQLTAAINEATAPRLVISDDSAPAGLDLNLSGARAGNVTIGEAAGRDIIKDNLFVVQTDNPLLLQAIEDRVTQAFFACVDALVAQQRVLFLFDSYERTSQEGERWVSNAADRWIQGQLLSRVRDGRLPNCLVVLAGRRLPLFGPEWRGIVGEMPLNLFTAEDVAQYLRDNRGLTALTDAEVQTLFSAVQGNPQLLGIIGDNLEQAARPAADDDW